MLLLTQWIDGEVAGWVGQSWRNRGRQEAKTKAFFPRVACFWLRLQLYVLTAQYTNHIYKGLFPQSLASDSVCVLYRLQLYVLKAQITFTQWHTIQLSYKVHAPSSKQAQTHAFTCYKDLRFGKKTCWHRRSVNRSKKFKSKITIMIISVSGGQLYSPWVIIG